MKLDMLHNRIRIECRKQINTLNKKQLDEIYYFIQELKRDKK